MRINFWIGLIILFVISASMFVYCYRKPHLISKIRSEDGDTTLIVQAQRKSWLLEGFEVRAHIFDSGQTTARRSLLMDDVDLLLDAREAYGSPLWVDDAITFEATGRAGDEPITLEVNRITPQDEALKP